jgi:DNA-binding winged helix-turn-helix (wHTH) protein
VRKEAGNTLPVSRSREILLYEFDGFRLDPERRLLVQTPGGAPVVLAPKVFDTLLYFVEHRGELLDKATLFEAIWPGTIVEENSLNQNISMIRRVLGEKPAEHRFIVTVPRRGYRFVSDVRAVPRLQTSPVSDTEAHVRYQQARALYVMPDEARLRQVFTLLDEATQREPHFAAALSLKAAARLHCVLFGYALDHALEDAEREARLALEIDPKLIEPHGVLGQLNAFRGRWLAAESHFRSALDSGQYDVVTAVIYCSCLLIPVGHLYRAEREMKRAHELAPASVPVSVILALLDCLRGNDGEAMRHLSLSVALGGPVHLVPYPQIRAHAARRAGRYGEAAEHLIAGLSPGFRAIGGADVVARVYEALADAHETATALEAVRGLVDSVRSGAVDTTSAKDVLVWCTLLGDVDLAHEIAECFLDRLAQAGTVGSAWDPLWLPEMKPFRQHPRFQSFVARVGFPDYWRVHGAPVG